MARTVEQLEAEKSALLKDFLGLQDEIEALNGREYELACRIKAVDLELKEAREARAKAIATLSLAAGATPPSDAPSPQQN